MKRVAMVVVIFLSFVLGISLVLADDIEEGTKAKEAKEKKEKAKVTEEKKVPETKMEEVVVTATRTEKEVESAPGSVSVVTKKDIERRDVKTVDQALNTVAGVFNRRGKGLMDTLAQVSLRGIPGYQRNLVLMDGLALNDSYTGKVSFGGLEPGDIERIEVVKGPFSSLYGGYAMGGVVNIITKMPEKRELTLKTGYGTSSDRGEAMDDFGRYYFSYGDKLKNKLSLFLSYGYKDTNGYPSDLNVVSIKPPSSLTGWSYTRDRYGNRRYLIGDKGDNRWWDDNITFKTKYDLSENSRVNFSFMRTRYEYNYDDPHTYLKDSTTGNEVWSYSTIRESSFLSGNGGREQNLYNLSYEAEVSSVRAKLSLGMVDVLKNWYTSPGTYATNSGGTGKVSDTPSRFYNTDLQLTLPLFNAHLLTFGSSFRYGWADTKEHNLSNWNNEDSDTTLSYQSKGKDRTYSLYLQDEIMILDNLTAYIGFRQDWWRTFEGYANNVGISGYPKKYPSHSESSFNPKAALVYHLFNPTTLRASVGKAFRSPTVYELYRTWVSSSTGITYAGNPALKPEKVRAWDIGISQRLWPGARIDATYFENYLHDLIYLRTVTPKYQDYVNIDKAESKGVEVEIEQKLGKEVRLFGNFTYNDTEVKDNEAKPETEGKRLTYMPEKMFNFGVELEKNPFSFSFIGRYVGKIYGDDENKDRVSNVYGSYDLYFTADTKLAYRIKDFAILSFSVDNIFDRDYFYYYRCPGRSWSTELTIKY